jgi:hypothetical protein
MSTLYNGENGEIICGGLDPQSRSDQAVKIAREIARDDGSPVVLEDERYTVFLPCGRSKTKRTWDKAIKWLGSNYEHGR